MGSCNISLCTGTIISSCVLSPCPGSGPIVSAFPYCLVNFSLPLFHFVLRLQNLEGEKVLEMTSLICLFSHHPSDCVEYANFQICALFWKLWSNFEVCLGGL